MTIQKAKKILNSLVGFNEFYSEDFKKLIADWPDDSLTRSMISLSEIFAYNSVILDKCLHELEGKPKRRDSKK